MLDTLRELLSYTFLIRALVVGCLVSLCAALLGVTLVLKRYSMIGDGLSHVGFGALAIATVLFLAGRSVLSLFVDPKEAMVEDVLDVALRYLHVMLAGLFILYLLYVYRSALQGMGNTLIPMLSGAAARSAGPVWHFYRRARRLAGSRAAADDHLLPYGQETVFS